MTLRPIPGPWRVPAPFRPRYVDTAAHEVAYMATCDRGQHDATWLKARDAARPTCTCQPQEGAA